MSIVSAATNPLLAHGKRPQFRAIRPEHVVPAIRQIIDQQNAAFTALETSAKPTWAGVIEPLRELSEALSFAWGAVNHLLGVRNSPELRTAHESVQADVVAAAMRLGQSDVIHRQLVALRDDATQALTPAQRRVVDGAIKDGEQSGIALQGAQRERFNALAVELSDLASKFQNQILDASKQFALELTDPSEVEGLPDTTKAQAAQMARTAGAQQATAAKGPWRITLDMPLYIPFMEHATRSDLREKLYRAFITRASMPPYDNGPLVHRILAARQEQAQLLGFANYADLSLSRKMAGSVATVDALLEQIRVVAKPVAEREWADLQAFARKQSNNPTLAIRHWDVSFWSERQREKLYDYSEEALRPYFPFERVLDGMFALVERIFGVTVTPGDAETWNDDVRVFDISEQGKVIASFYLDAFSRSGEKRGGAWMDVCLDRCVDHRGTRLPVAYLVCNQAAPVDGQSALMSYTEMETLFHEFGHGLQHMLTRLDHPEVAGINRVEWDAVELPSQFMENWCYHFDTVTALSKHVETGASLPEALFNKITAARTYRAGSQFLRQVAFSTVDLRLHEMRDQSDFAATIAKVWSTTTVLAPLPEDRFLCGFSHIFAGGYSAGYFSYKWAEVLSADAFGAFEEVGLDNLQAVSDTGRRFRETVLALGGGTHPAEVFRSFRGRDPSPEPLLASYGLLANAG